MTHQLIKESGGSFAMVSAKESKTVYGQPAVASTKLNINGTAEQVSGDIRQLVSELNGKLKFWKPDNPYLANGYMFNGSSHHLMNPEMVSTIETIKPEFGDIDVIVPLPRLGDLEDYLDSHLDDGRVEWTPTEKNRFNDKFCYIGRPRSNHKIPDQTVTLWWYLPRKQIVQIDFEGDMMVPVVSNGKTYLRPSQWVKFSKSSPLPDMKAGIKGLAHKIMLRTLARTVFYLGDVKVLTPTGKVSHAKKHEMPSLYTFNPAGMNGGLRRSYKKDIGNPDEHGNPVEGYQYVSSKAIPAMPKEYAYITDLPTIFEMLFKKHPDKEELHKFNSFVGLIEIIQSAYTDGRMDLQTVKRSAVYFKKLMLDQTGVDVDERIAPVKYMGKQLKSILES